MPDVFVHLPENPTSPSTNTQPQSPETLTLLFFIPGNPGLIEYYTPFLTLLIKKSEEWSQKGKNLGVVGFSLGGFEAPIPSPSIYERSGIPIAPGSGWTVRNEAEEESLGLLYPSDTTRRKARGTYTLKEQIALTHGRILGFIERLQRREGPVEVEVILAGHSVGAYIALEVVKLHHERYRQHPDFAHEFTIVSTILLTPTIINIAHSPSGRIATPLLSYLPFLPTLLQLGASGLTGTLPKSWMRGLVRRITGMKDDAVVNVTASFLERSGAVRQALDMAGWEMREIGVGSWEEAVWGVVEGAEKEGSMADGKEGEEAVGGETNTDDGDGNANGTVEVSWRPPFHHFLFAKEDHWVADETRETIVSSMNGRAKILVDDGELGLVHAWCLEQSEMVARIVSGWIEEVQCGKG